MRKIIIFIVLIFISKIVFADTIHLKDGTKEKGLVVEEYIDRIVFSTADGEKELLKKDIDSIEYDTPEQNLYQIGREYEKRGWYEKAAFYYRRALEINPEYKEARDAFLSSHTLLWREEEARAKKELEHRRLVLDWRNRKGATESSVSIPQGKNEVLRKNLGLELLIDDGNFIVANVVEGSDADNSGIKEGDFLSAIWGRLIRYTKFEDVFNELNIPQFSEVKFSIERDLILPSQIDAEAIFKIGYDGLFIKELKSDTVAGKAGLKTGDLIIYIDKTPTRYMPLERAIELIKSKDSQFIVRIKRDVLLRRTTP